MDVDDEKSIHRDFAEHAGVEDALREAVVVHQKLIIPYLPDPSSVAATWHVAGDREEIAGAVLGVVRGVVAKVGQPWWNVCKHEASTVLGRRGFTVVVCAADVLGVLEGALLDCDLSHDSVR